MSAPDGRSCRDHEGNLLELAVFGVASGGEESVAENHVVDTLCGRVVEYVAVDKEEDGEVDLFSR